MKGRVKWWSEDQGYGFIEYNDNQNVFAHVEREDKNKYNITENQEIEFVLEEKAEGTFLKILQPINN